MIFREQNNRSHLRKREVQLQLSCLLLEVACLNIRREEAPTTTRPLEADTQSAEKATTATAATTDNAARRVLVVFIVDNLFSTISIECTIVPAGE